MTILDRVITNPRMREQLRQVLQAPAGILAVNGGAGSGKTTTLFAMAADLVESGTECVVVTSDPNAFKPDFARAWQYRLVDESEQAWMDAVKAANKRGAVALAHIFDYHNARALTRAAIDGARVLTQVDSSFVGIDVAYGLHSIGVTNADLLDAFSCIVSQTLLSGLCQHCRVRRKVEASEAAMIYPGATQAMELWHEVGCDKCEGRGTRDRQAIQEVLAINSRSRPILAEYLATNVVRAPLAEDHFTLQDSARELVRHGEVGFQTYKQEIFRNPTLRLNHQWEQERLRAAHFEIASEHKTAFLANMSHELRTPLNAIIGFSEALSEGMFGELNDKQLDYLRDINQSGKHLLSLINDILDLSKVEAGRMELELASFGVPEALRTALALLRERAMRHGIELVLEVAPEVGEIEADERKLKQILLNLLSNAVKFTPDGGRIELSAKATDAGVAIAVRDSGIGISSEDQRKLFQEFQQVGVDQARKAEGTGLGLALTKRLVELHGGEISVQSAVGSGTTFTVVLPRNRGR